MKLKNKIMTGVQIFLALYLLALGATMIWGSGMNQMLYTVGLLLAGAYLIIESHINLKNIYKHFTGWWKGTFHVVSFALGILLLYMGVGTLIANIQIAALMGYNGIILLVSGVWVVLEKFIN